MNFENIVFIDSVGFRCKTCGICCCTQPPDVDKAEQKRIETKGFRDFLDRPDETGIVWIRRKKDGSCHFLTKNNKCVIYDLRPAICRLEPFTITDFDYEKNRIELELNFPFSCNCIGISERQEILHVEEIAKAAQTIVQRILTLTAKDLGLPITDKRVYSETRSRLLRRRIDIANLQL
ncbi:MAG: YkgJ family cysteine cluster protein [Candidatus Bathyarchaeia archaeon]